MKRDELWNAGIGAVVTIVLSFTGFSALLGGGVAGYLQDVPPKRGAKTGAISGGIAVIPILLVFVVGFGLFLGQPSALGIPGGLELAIIFLVMFPLLFAWTIGLSAVGGYLGAYLRSNV
ncbi:DUF5518 domain-containing protein [Halanaeroarchaeum sulfurireducens]|uniref:DUF5518 domain-containing protein n=1 Tax=Halanaeroarchaeum sulfurireducens TaxID=1604004 RepID=A0A0F7PCV9_9EURY|nr:DUF5518 domain-containing protein [Halanaeroarchaeum sulfurireducens]AKH97474.1 hypothetical protein HLASF_0984 [Halanaeroarchaeum sulfurireducens]ALG81870.1 hypothetical protein HLASA_0973 [Halanaeroarchaeum sulfurireducens]